MTRTRARSSVASQALLAALSAALFAGAGACSEDGTLDGPRDSGARRDATDDGVRDSGPVEVPDAGRPLDAASAPDATSAADAGVHPDASGPLDALPPPAPAIADGDDWSLPPSVTPSPRSGFFSESPSPAHHVDTRVVDLTWRQLVPAPGMFDTSATDTIYDMAVGSFDEQLAGSDPYWLRIWISSADVAPEWVIDTCGIDPVADGYEGEPELPMWNACFWGYALELYREVLLHRGMRSDPRLQFAYVPGGFTWCEFDFDIISEAVADGSLDHAELDTWLRGAIADLVSIMNGENSDPSDDQAHKLVYTGEDYPFGPFEEDDDLYARDAVLAGMGIRTGIPELSNFHLSHVPAYGTTIAADGHMVTDASWVALDGRRVVAGENECFDACGFSTNDPEYAVKMANLKALQLRMNWLYVVPKDSFLDEYAEHWEWVRSSLGKTAATSPDAWAALRDAEDRYWIDDDSHTWPAKPWVRNLERWLVQREVSPDGVPRRGSDVRTRVLDRDNGTAYEGLATDLATGQVRMYFDVDDQFLHARTVPVELKVTFLDRGVGSFVLEYEGVRGLQESLPAERTGSGAWRTATFRVEDATFGGRLPNGTDFAIREMGPDDLEVRFVRVVKL